MKTTLFLSYILFYINAHSQNIASGYYHSLSICPDSTTQAWGNNSRGQLGNGTNSYSNIPVSAFNLADIINIDGGFYYSMALKKDSTVWTWGDNYSGTLGNGTSVDSNLAAQVMGLSNVKSIAAGGHHALVLKYDSTVWAWGANAAGQLGTGNYIPSLVPIQVPGLDSVVAVAAGDDHSLALKSDSTVWAWGMNDQGELGTGSTTPWTIPTPSQVVNLNGVVAIAGGSYKFSFALKADGTVWAWGYNQWGQLGNGTNVQSSIPVQVSNLSGITAIAVHGGQGHALALRNDSTVWSWGYNIYGQLGNGNNMDTNAAVQVIGLTNVVAISCGHGFSLAQKSDGTVWGWGDNQHGQLGIGTFTGVYNNPVQVTSLCSMLSSINETERENVFSVFPNPTSELIWIKMNTFNYSKGSSIEIYNSTGALFYKTCIDSPEIVVDLSTYSKGLYIIKLFDGKVSQTKRMVIE